MGNWLNKLWFIQVMEYSVEKNRLESFYANKEESQKYIK